MKWITYVSEFNSVLEHRLGLLWFVGKRIISAVAVLGLVSGIIWLVGKGV